ncbi:hypothetical protein [Phytohabitans suffuscus]|uniref:hypothetical protein n=1 Tax=Phytohabitans suffuscus TaxID=624315 RepID=UPI001E36A240|nr:hypothetical protein [Phytohabitans suffuscus]
MPLALPKLERMSERTMPLSSSTLGPFEPSPGYGPAVSSGISPVAVAAAPVADAAAEEAEDGAEVPPPPPAPQAARPIPVTPRPSALSTRRRPIRVPRSKRRPWSTSSSSGRGSGRPWYSRGMAPPITHIVTPTRRRIQESARYR